MGLFSDSVTQVATSVSRVIPDKNLPNSIQKGLITGIMQNGDIPEYILEELVSSVGVKTERMYEYAKNHYTYGLPSGLRTTNTQGRDAVQVVLNTLEGQPVVVDYSNFGPKNAYHTTWMALVSGHAYNPTTNELPLLSASKGKTVKLESFQIVYPKAMYDELGAAELEFWGASSVSGDLVTRKAQAQTPTLAAVRTQPPVISSTVATFPYAQVTALWEDVVIPPNGLFPNGAGRINTEVFTISLADPDDEGEDYFQVRYRVGGQIKYWRYEVNTGTYPTLDAYYTAAPETAGTYFPFLYFRHKKQSMALLEGTPGYTTSRKMAKYLGINYGDLVEAVHENPQIDDVEQAMLIYAVPPNTTNQMELKYLFDYFSEQYFFQNPEGTGSLASVTWSNIKDFTSLMGPARNTTVIQDQRFKMSLANNGIFKKIIPLKIGKIGTHAGGFRPLRVMRDYKNAETGEITRHQVKSDAHYFQRQVTASLCEEIEVHDLRLLYHIWKGYTKLGDNEKSFLLVPLDRSITQTYSLPEREELYARSMHYVFNSRITTELAWYQSDFFQFVMLVVVVVITVITLGKGSFLMSLAQMSFKALVLAIAMKLLEMVIVSLAIKLFIKVVGKEFAFLTAILAVIAAAYGVYTEGSLQGAPWATELLKLSAGISSGISSSLQEAFGALAEEYEAFNLLAENQLDRLESAQDLLEGSNLLSPFVIFGESPDDFFNRTVHSGNIGVVGISAISNYVDVALTLPKLSDTSGDFA